jgi:hypothetical protein
MTLNQIFKIAKHLNTVLLVDKANVFIEKHTLYQETHNRRLLVTAAYPQLNRGKVWKELSSP